MANAVKSSKQTKPNFLIPWGKMQELQDSTGFFLLAAAAAADLCSSEVISNLPTCLLPFIMRRKTHKWSPPVPPPPPLPGYLQRFRSGHTCRRISGWSLTPTGGLLVPRAALHTPQCDTRAVSSEIMTLHEQYRGKHPELNLSCRVKLIHVNGGSPTFGL